MVAFYCVTSMHFFFFSKKNKLFPGLTTAHLHLRVKGFVQEVYIEFLAYLRFKPVTGAKYFLLRYHYLSRAKEIEMHFWKFTKRLSPISTCQEAV